MKLTLKLCPPSAAKEDWHNDCCFPLPLTSRRNIIIE